MAGKRRLWIVLLIVAVVVVLAIVNPVRVVLNVVKRVDLTDPVAAGAALVETYHCRDCHEIDGYGGVLGPTLTRVTERMDRDLMTRWLRNPLAIKRDTRMPVFWLSDSEIEALIAYLDTREH